MSAVSPVPPPEDDWDDEHASALLGSDVISATPFVTITNALDPMVQSATSALCRDPVTYQRGGALVYVAHVDADERRVWLPNGTPIIRTMTRATLRVRLSECAEWRKPTRPRPGAPEAYFITRPDESVVAAVLDSAEYRGMRVLVGISETPIIRPDGTLIQTVGYDDVTGFVYVPNAEYPPIKDEPSQAEAAEALAELNEPFADFEFSSPEGAAVPIAAILTIVGRPGVDGPVPAYLIEAAVRGAGKTLCSDVITMAATGRCASRTTYPEEDDELCKVLDGYALQGAPVIPFDNVSRPFGGAALDAFLTARDEVNVRELGRTGQKSVPWRSTVLATGNNIQIRGDTGRRVLFSRLEPTTEKPEDRKNFRHADLIGYVRENRPRLVAAALTILSAYIVAGRPDVLGATWGSFEGWTALVASSIKYAGGPNVLDARLGSADDGRDSDHASLESLIVGLSSLMRDQDGFRARDVISALWPAGGRGDTPDGYDDLRDAIESMTHAKPGRAPNGRQLADVLRKSHGRWVSGRRLKNRPGSKGVMRWAIESADAVRPNGNR